MHTEISPKYILLDPELTLATPMRLWLSTGMRAVDHACESAFGQVDLAESADLYRPSGSIFHRLHAVSAVKMLFEGLVRRSTETSLIVSRAARPSPRTCRSASSSSSAPRSVCPGPNSVWRVR